METNATVGARAGVVTIGTETPEVFSGLVRFDTLTLGQATFEVTTRAAFPLLAPGEFAVIDTADRTPRDGELFVIQWEGGERRRCILQARARTTDRMSRKVGDEYVPYPEGTVSWWMGDIRPLTVDDIAKARAACPPGQIPVLGGLSDGPYLTEHLASKLIGRVIGYAETDLGNLLPHAAGWENEDEGNAAFDAAEYVDAMYGVGHAPWVFMRGDGMTMGWGESFCPAEPRNPNPTEADEARFMASRMAYIKSSRAYEMVLAELVRRGLDAGAAA